MRKSEEKGDNCLGPKRRILEFTYSESSHQIQQLGKNRIFVHFFEQKLSSSPMWLSYFDCLGHQELENIAHNGRGGLMEFEWVGRTDSTP